MQHVLNIQYGPLLKKYLKCSFWRLAVRYDNIHDIRRQRVKQVVMPVRKLVDLHQPSTAFKDEQAKKSIPMIYASRG
jgi:hypothetical protein